MSYDPTNTRWSVSDLSNDAVLGITHGTPWEFHRYAISGRGDWVGGYRPIPGTDNAYVCEIILHGTWAPAFVFEVVFLNPERFVATKNNLVFAFGKKL